MSDTIGNITVPDPGTSGAFPLQPLFGYVRTHEPMVAIHQFGSANFKIEQRFLLGNGAKQFTFQWPELSESQRASLRTFWESRKGAYQPFTLNYPKEDQSGTTAIRVRFANAPLSWQYLADQISSVGITLIEDADPAAAPTYTLNSTSTRFPSGTLQTALLSQVQQMIPLVKITVKESGYPAIYVSDRRCTIGSQLYQARLTTWDGIGQSMNGESDTATFKFGNADRVMRDLSNDTDLWRATVQFSLFHVGTGIKVDLWAGEVRDFAGGETTEFALSCSDSMFELTLDYPQRKVDRTCWKTFNDGVNCPYAAVNPSGTATSCDKSWDTGCSPKGMTDYFGGIIAKPQGVTTKDNTSGTWGVGRRLLTTFSLVNDTIYGAPLTEIYTDERMPVNCLIAAGRDEGDFYSALGIVGAGPLSAYDTSAANHQLDGQTAHGPLTGDSGYGLRRSYGHDPVQDHDPDNDSDQFSLSAVGGGFTGEKAAGVAFIEIRRTDAKGLQLSQVTQHQMVVSVQGGLGAWYWTDPSTRVWGGPMTNPIWVAVNTILRARGLLNASASLQTTVFDVQSAISMAAICANTATKVIGSGTETQFKYRGIIADTKPLRDWLQDILINCLGYWVNSFGKIKFGLRINSSAVEAFTAGNIILGSLQLSSIRPAYNDLTANFADVEFSYATNNVRIYDETHRAKFGRASAQINLPGTAWKSQTARIATTRLREEIGGVTEDEWRDARNGAFKTTVLALNVEPGMVCSLTHEDMPSGAGEFRIQGWRLNPDYSIDLSWKSTTDSMYDLTVGPKPADVTADPIPVEATRDAPFPWAPGYDQPITGDTIFTAENFGLKPNTAFAATGAPITKLDIYGNPPLTRFSPTASAPILNSVTVASGGSIAGGRTVVVGISANDAASNALVTPLSNLIVVTIPAGSGYKLVLNVTWGSSSYGASVYVASQDATHPFHLEGTIGSGATTGTHSYDLTSIVQVYLGPPDAKLAFLRFRQVKIVHAGCWAEQLTGKTSTSLTFSSATFTTNQWAGYKVSLLAFLDQTATPIIWDATVVSNTATTLTISGPSTAPLSIGDLIVMRMKPSSTSINGFSDANLVNCFEPSGLAVSAESGNLAWIIAGTGAGQRPRLIRDNGSGSGPITLAEPWDIAPDSTSIIIITEPTFTQVDRPPLAMNSYAGFSGLLASLDITNYLGQAFAIIALTVSGSGAFDASWAPIREIYRFGVTPDVRTITANATMLASDVTVLIDTTSSSVDYTLLPTAAYRGRVVNVIWKAGANTARILPAVGETVFGGSSFTFTTLGEPKQLVANG